VVDGTIVNGPMTVSPARSFFFSAPRMVLVIISTSLVVPNLRDWTQNVGRYC
jgi:hypothetical protein